MAINFPNSPTLDQTFSSGNNTYIWNGNAWVGYATTTTSGGTVVSSQWGTVATGIHTLSNVGIGTTNATSALTVKGNTSLESLTVSGVSTVSSRLTISKDTETKISGIELRVVSQITDGNNDGIFFTQTGIGTIPLGSIRCEYTTNGKPDFGIYTRDDNIGGIGTESRKLIIKNNGFIGIGTTNPTSALTVKGNTSLETLNVSGVSTFTGRINSGHINAVGVITATSFVGDGSGLTGIVATGSGLEIRDNSTVVGVATIIDFGNNLDVAFNSGIATVTQSLQSGTTSFSATAGVTTTILTIPKSNVLAEYTFFFQQDSKIQSQKLQVMHNGVTAYAQEYAIMFEPGILVSVGATISSNNILIQVTPQAGVSGITTIKYQNLVLI